MLVDHLQAIIVDHGDVRQGIRDILAGDPTTWEDSLYKLVIGARPNLQQIIIAIGTLLDRGYGKPSAGNRPHERGC